MELREKISDQWGWRGILILENQDFLVYVKSKLRKLISLKSLFARWRILTNLQEVDNIRKMAIIHKELINVMWPFPHAKLPTEVSFISRCTLYNLHLLHEQRIKKKVSPSRKSLSKGVVSAFGPNVLTQLHFQSIWLVLTCMSSPLSMKKKINGPVSCMQLINAMQWLRQLNQGCTSLFSILGMDHNHCEVQRLCHCDMSALQELCFSCQIKSTSLPLHLMCMLLSIYSQPSISWGGFSYLRHALHHHCDVAQNTRWSHFLWVTYMYLDSCIKHSCIFSSCLQLRFSWLLSLRQVWCGITHVGSRIYSFVAIQSLYSIVKKLLKYLVRDLLMSLICSSEKKSASGCKM